MLKDTKLCNFHGFPSQKVIPAFASPFNYIQLEFAYYCRMGFPFSPVEGHFYDIFIFLHIDLRA